jgi:magnesium-transporting ATPase (P-type)
MTISNIITLYIVYLSFLNKNTNLREKIIYLFNSLKECKFSFFKIKRLLKSIVIYLKEWTIYKLKFLKNNLFSILLTLIIIISVANVFRQPIFIFLGKDIFDNFYLYIYIMFSSILPTTYIITILSKRFKTNNLDFSFRLTDLKEKITVLSIILLTVSLYISYFYI